MRSRSAKDAGVQQVDAGGAGLVGQVDEPHPVDEGRGHVFEDAGRQVGVGVDDDDGVRVPALGLLPQLVGDEVVHERGLAHARPRDIEVMTPEQIVGEADLPLRARGGVPHQRAAPDPLGGRAERPCAGPLHQGRLVAGAGRMPQAGDLADAQHTALSEQAGACRVQHLRVGHDGPDFADLEARPGGVVVVPVGGGDRAEKLPRPLRHRVRGQDRRHLKLGVEGDAGDLLAYQDGVVNAVAGLLPAEPCPAADGQPQGRARPQERRLP